MSQCHLSSLFDQIKYTIKRNFYYFFVKSKFVRLVNSPVCTVLLPITVAFYHGTLDIWGDDWGFIVKYKDTHELVFTFSIFITVAILSIHVVSEHSKSRVTKRYEEIIGSTMAFFNELVKSKRDRFHKKAKSLSYGADPFKKITQPQEQIEASIYGIIRLLNSVLGIDKKNIEITIMSHDAVNEKWIYLFSNDKQKRLTKPKVLMDSRSTARHCLNTGESVFIADIRKGIKEGIFFESERSKVSKTGSIYCKSIRVNVSERKYTYIFTICVYCENVCTPYDADECRTCENVFDEIADRIELELCLYSIKHFKENGRSYAKDIDQREE